MEEKEMVPYEELTFASDFLFCKILESRPDLCKDLVELILNRKVKEVRNVRAQLSLKEAIGSKGVRFDIIFNDDENVIYDVEMQTTSARNLPKRTRYYQSMLDHSSIEKGLDYEELPQSYIIFICTFDPFDIGRHIYSFENRCAEETVIRLNDETKKVFLSTEGDKADVSPAIQEFLDYVAGRSVIGDLAEHLESEVIKAKKKEEWRVEYMENQAFYMDARREGRTEGETKLAKLISLLFRDGRAQDAQKAAADENARKEFYRQYGIVD